jgi:hypothetical protein
MVVRHINLNKMPKVVSKQELDQIVDLIAQNPNGIGLDLIAKSMNITKRRTLQRRLASLVSQQRVQLIGEGKAAKYILPRKEDVQTELEAKGVASDEEIYLPISVEAKEIKTYVKQPRQSRKPVGYQIGFLEQYHPNQTFYLPVGIRDQLHSLGRSPAENTPAGTFARDILNRLLIDLSWASSRLEGNTYTRLDTERLIEFGQAAEGKDAMETQMILNHKAAIEYLVMNIDQADVSQETIIALHAFLSDGLMADPFMCGRIRNRAVDIGGSVYLPIGLPQRLEELFGIILVMAAEIQDPFEQAFFLMVHLPYLQPFEDVNKRVSRLAANIPLIRRNLCPLSFIDVPQQTYVDAMIGVYELNRIELLRDVFIWAYERSCQQYVAVQQHLVPPDTFRLRYRLQLSEVVATIVRNGLSVEKSVIQPLIPDGVPESDNEHFVELVNSEFKTLHAGNAVRFGLRPLEFDAWQEKAKTINAFKC